MHHSLTIRIVAIFSATLVATGAEEDLQGSYSLDHRFSQQSHRAYEPFEELEKRRQDDEMRARWEFAKNRVVIRMATPQLIEKRLAEGSQVPATLKNIPGIKSVSRLFPEEALPKMKAWRAQHPALDRWFLAELNESTNIKILLARLNENPLVDIAEPDYFFKLADAEQVEPAPRTEGALTAIPDPSNNPGLEQQWYLSAANVEEAWQYLDEQGLPAGGSSDVVVAVIDSGVAFHHRDIAPNMWVNTQEIPDNGIDDDNNGIVDDIHGADFLSDRSNHNGDPSDDNGHGTHVAGIIAAVADNDIGGVGVAYNAKVMAIKAAQYSGILNSSDIAESIYYAVENGADIINMSFGSYAQSSLVVDALEAAFSQAVLVAAAGNDSKYSEARTGLTVPAPFYPASYPFVLGIMAESATPNPVTGEWLAGFSNWDSSPSTRIEYELMAPGTGIYSTIPGEQYAAWNGTSMAAPVAAGAAALVRTRYPDKSIYSSRFIMGQLSGTGATKLGKTHPSIPAIQYFSLDCRAAVATTPQPDIALIDYRIFDHPSLSEVNDGDGIVDSGETIEVAITIKNRWGKADPVTVTLAAQAQGAEGLNPYVTWDIDTVDYGAIGNFGQSDNGITINEEGSISGVTRPFRFTVATNTPNEHLIPIAVYISAGNGFDSEDPNTPYDSLGRFTLAVQRGRALPSVIEDDLMMTKDNYWIVERPVLIPEGISVTITEGTQVQFWNPELSGNSNPYIRVEGTLNVVGTEDQPVELFPADSLPFKWVEIHQIDEENDGETGTLGRVNLEYFKIINPHVGKETRPGRSYEIESARHGFLTQTNCWMEQTDGNSTYIYGPKLQARESYKILFKNLGGYIVDTFSLFRQDPQGPFLNLANPDTCLVNRCITRTNDSTKYPRLYRNTVFLNPHRLCSARPSWAADFRAPGQFSWGRSTPLSNENWQNNAVLLELWREDPRFNFRFYANDSADSGGDISSTFWGTTSIEGINNTIVDRDDDFALLGDFIIEPILTEAPESCWPFVVDCKLSTDLEDDVTVVGAEDVQFTITFNRDMDPNRQPKVAFGPDEPYNDFSVTGNWRDVRTWVGSFSVNSITGDGYQHMRISDAAAADDSWLVTGDDTARFRFRIATAGTEALTLQATGGEGFIDLSWGQDDYELLAGYNLYRAINGASSYDRINSTIIPVGSNQFRDTSVEPGQTYDYYFKVVLTDMSESESSNTATGSPLDTIPAVISHSPITTAQPSQPLTIAATITDNVAVSGAILFYRLAESGSSYQSRNMVNVTGERWTATLEGSVLQAPGVEYYLSATDGVSTTLAGRSENPYLVAVDDRPVVTGITPNRGPASGGSDLQITGSNFKEGASVMFEATPAASVTFVNSTLLNVRTPAHIPATVTPRVTNPGGRVGSLLNGFTFIDDLADLYLSDLTAESGGFISVPLDVANLAGLVAIGVTINYDPTQLRFSSVTKGSFLQDWTLVSNGDTEGEIRLGSASSGTGLSGSGSIAILEFQVLGEPGDVTALTLSDISLNDSAITPSETSGTVTVEAFSTLSGSVYFWGNSSNPVEGVTVTLEGAGTRTAHTDNNGEFTLSQLPLADYQLSFSKVGEQDGISALDAALVLRHFVGLETLSGPSLIAADVDRNGQVSPMDAFRILQHSAGLQDISIPGGGVAWVFEPPTRNYTELSQNLSGQDANAILLGDVSGNWNSTTQQGDEGVKLEVYSVTDYRTDKTLTRILLQTGQETLLGADIGLSYDPSLVASSITCPGFTCASNTRTAGSIRIAIANASGVTGNRIPIEIIFDRATADPRITLSRVSLNEGGLTVTGPVDQSVFDQDGDGLLDIDEAAYFATKVDSPDSDGDGQSDADELFAATDPTNFGSVFRILSINTGENGTLRLAWQSTVGTNYRIERSATLNAEDWVPIGETVQASSTYTVMQVDRLSETEGVFYRVVVTR